jgi:CBS domain containing-hemolysin-like protein
MIGLLIAALLRWARRDLHQYIRAEAAAAAPAKEPDPESPPALDADDRRLARRLAALMSRRIAEVMIPTTGASQLRASEPLPEVAARLRAERVSRLPVLDDRGRRAIGILVIKDLLSQLPIGADDGSAPQAAELCRPIPTVSSEQRVAEVLEALRHEGGLAAVIDRDGELAGFISWTRIFQALAPGAES